MITLNEIAEIIAHALGRQFDYTLRESIKYSVLWHREELLRRDLDRNGLNSFDFLQTFCFKLEPVDSGECGLQSGKTVLRSINKIPRPVRFKSNGRSNFMFVGTGDRSTSFTFANFIQVPYILEQPYTANVIYYGYKNEKIEIYNNNRLCEGLVEGIFADPRGYGSECGDPYKFTDDSPLPISSDLLKTIREGIINGEFPILNQNKDINIEQNAE